MVRIWIDDQGIVRLETRHPSRGTALFDAHESFYAEHWDAFLLASRWLADYRGFDFESVHPDVVKSLAIRSVEIAGMRPPLRIAVLVDAGLGFGLARMWEQLANSTGWTLGTFTDEDEAWTWLLGGPATGPEDAPRDPATAPPRPPSRRR